jgi:hypothetical protein
MPTTVSLASYYPTAPSVTSTHRKVSEEDMQSSHDAIRDIEVSSDSLEQPSSGKSQNSVCSLKRRAQSVCLADLVANEKEEEPMSRHRQRRVVSPITTCLSRSESSSHHGDHGASSPTSWGLFAFDEVSDTEADEDCDWSTASHSTSFIPHITNQYDSPRYSPSSWNHYHPYLLKKSEKRRCIRSPRDTPLKGFILKYPPVCVEETVEQLSSLGL